MEMKIAIILLMAGSLLLFGCAGKYGAAAKEKQGTETGGKANGNSPSGQADNAQATGGSSNALTESDLALFEDADSVPELSDLPMDDGS